MWLLEMKINKFNAHAAAGTNRQDYCLYYGIPAPYDVYLSSKRMKHLLTCPKCNDDNRLIFDYFSLN